MIPNNNLSVLPFYDTLIEQNHNSFKNFGTVHDFICSNTKILPFQIIRPHSSASFTTAVLHSLDGLPNVDIFQEMVDTGSRVRSFVDYDLIVNPSAMILPNLILEAGRYYLEIGDDSPRTWYSEVFTIVEDTTPYVRIEYYNTENILFTGGSVDYSHPFKNYFYAKTAIGKPEYPFEEEAQKRDGHTFVEKQISQKKYKFTFLAPEHLCDSVRIIRMHDTVKIYEKNRIYDVENIIFEPKWETQGDLAAIEVEFTCDTVVKNIGRSIVIDSVEFSNDFSNDFNIE